MESLIYGLITIQKIHTFLVPQYYIMLIYRKKKEISRDKTTSIIWREQMYLESGSVVEI